MKVGVVLLVGLVKFGNIGVFNCLIFFVIG